jgi:hypothetical protein
MIVLAATGVELGLTMRAGIVGIHVFLDAQLISANSAQNCLLVKFYLWPDLMVVIRLFFMAGKAGIILVTALEFDSNDVQLGMPMHAAGLVVHWLAKYVDSPDLGDFERFEYFFLAKRSPGNQEYQAE